MIGRALSHYNITEKLGSGGMGDVYVAEDTELDRKVALKVLPSDLAENEERRSRFKREAKAVASLNHPNIVTVFSVEEADGVHFITMEMVAGKTLSDVIPEKGMTLSRFFEVAIPVADAVAAAHREGVTHRDLKPDNVMLSDEGRVKILDFGLAKLTRTVASEGMSELPHGEQALPIMEEVTRDHDSPIARRSLAYTYAAVGDLDRAFVELEEGFKTGYFSRHYFENVIPSAYPDDVALRAPMVADRRWEELIERYEPH